MAAKLFTSSGDSIPDILQPFHKCLVSHRHCLKPPPFTRSRLHHTQQPDKTLGGWCASSDAVNQGDVNWFDISFYGPVNVTSVSLQPPYTGGGGQPPTVDIFQLLYEPVDGELGTLQVYNDAAGSESFSTNFTSGDFEMVLDKEMLARRVRIQVSNFTISPCLRLDVKGCPVVPGSNPEIIPISCSCPGGAKVLSQLLFPHQSQADSGEADGECSFTLTDQNWMLEKSIAVTPNSGTQLTGVRRSQVTTNLVFDGRVSADEGKFISVA
ncbi:hypothetical protein ElyMa_006337200 [Elysia marginata]|uniref:Uncharacterized protein n=1 Tax=Elysia marginata TaxID=1093978 RepID=A0AAV4HJ86_9GAST|nr:hypothetical protein ElyMa_006337200 [Elysia marginata]